MVTSAHRRGMLFLFDIDGTLLRRMPPYHRQAVCDGLHAAFGLRLEPGDLGQTAGRTDAALPRPAVRAVGISPEDSAAGLPVFYAAAADAYGRHVPGDLRAYHTPHVVAALDWLAESGAALGLVTGNIEGIAWVKLRAAGLGDYFVC